MTEDSADRSWYSEEDTFVFTTNSSATFQSPCPCVSQTFRNSKNKETDVDTVVEAESKYSLFNLSTFAGRKSNYKAKLSIEYALCKCLAKF